MASYYGWNTQALVDWIRAEVSKSGSFQAFSKRLSIPQSTLRKWLVVPFPDVTLEQLRLIAHYRGCTVEDVVHWLGIQPAHLLEMGWHPSLLTKAEHDSSLLSIP